MARFLLTSDYKPQIQTEDLNQLLLDNGAVVLQKLYDAEVKAISKMRTKLVQRYMVDIELATMTVWDASAHYRTKERILTVASVIHSVKEFGRWSVSVSYSTDDIVTDDDGYVYTALQDSAGKELTSTSYWAAMTNIAVADTDYWAQTDNRYSLFVEYAIDLTLHLLYSSINPRNIPELRKERYREALDQLDAWAGGEDTAEVLEKGTSADQIGYSIRYGSSTDKQDNFF